MLKFIKLNNLWLGDISYVDTAAVDGAQQENHKPAANTPSHRWYCVTKGTEVCIFNAWYGHPFPVPLSYTNSLPGRPPLPTSKV